MSKAVLISIRSPRVLGNFTGLREMKNGFELSRIERPPQSWRYVEELP